MDTLARGKKSIAVDLKKKEGVALIRKLCASSDVLIEPYRPGEKRDRARLHDIS